MSIDWNKHKSNRWAADNVGAQIAGRVVSVREERRRDDDIPVLTLATADGEVEVWAGPVHLKQRLADIQPEPGDVLRIKLTDLVHTGQQSPMKRFDVRKSAPAAEPEPEEPY